MDRSFNLCGEDAKVCAMHMGMQECGVNVGACPADFGGACAVNVKDGDPFSFCIVNVIPFLPSC